MKKVDILEEVSSIGQRLKAVQERLGMDDAEFAKALYVDEGQVKKLQKGMHYLTEEKLITLCQLGVNPNYLFLGELPILKTDQWNGSIGGLRQEFDYYYRAIMAELEVARISEDNRRHMVDLLLKLQLRLNQKGEGDIS